MRSIVIMIALVVGSSQLLAQQTAVISSTTGDKVYLRVDGLSLRSNLDTLFANVTSLQGQIDNLSWADVLENGTTPGVDVDFFGYDATGLGQVTTTGTFTGDSLVLNKDAAITGRLDLSGVAAFGDSLLVEGTVVLNDSLRVVEAVSFGSHLHVTGVTALGDSLHVVGNVDFDALFNVDGAATFGSTLSVTGETTLSDTLQVNAAALFGDSVYVAGNAHLAGAVQVDGASALGSTLAVTGATTLSDALGVAGKATFADSLVANGGADFNSSLNVDGATTLNGTTIAGNLDLNGNGDVSGTLDVGGAASLGAALSVTGVTTLSDTLHAEAPAMLDDSLRVGGNTRLTQDLWVDGNTNIGGTVNITGATTLGGALSVTGVTSLGDSLHVSGGADFDGDVNVDGETTTGTLSVTNTATFSGPSTFTDAATFGDSLYVNAPAAFSDTTVFTGGAHITGGLNLDELVLNGVTIPALDNTDALPEGDSNLYFTAAREAALQAQIDLQDSLNAALTSVLDNLLNQLFDPATVTTNAASPVAAYTASLNAVFTDGGAEVEASGFEISTNSDLSDSTVYDATGAASLVEALTGLTKGTTYYYRAFVETIMGRAEGTIVSFTTVDDAQVSTLSATNVGAFSANLRGQITSTGGGTISATNFQYSTNNSLSGASTVGGSSNSGTFNGGISGLSAGTTYYYRARATNEAGTASGTIQNFTTIGLASVTTGGSSSVGPTTATLSGSVTGTGGGTISATGFQYSTSASFSSSSTKSGSSTSGSFTANLTGLNGSTEYYFRAFATNEAGTQYGTSQSFTTQALGPCAGATTYAFGGHTYPLVEAGGKCWFGEDVEATSGMTQTSLSSAEADGVCPTPIDCSNSNPFYSNNEHYAIDDAGGTLYDFPAKEGPACPSGWHSASQSDWSSIGGTDPFLNPPSSLGLTPCSTTGGQTLTYGSGQYNIQTYAGYWFGDAQLRVGNCINLGGLSGTMARVRCVKN